MQFRIEISEVSHWADTFQVLMSSNVQHEVQQTQVPSQFFFSSATTGKHRFKSPMGWN